MKEYHYLVASLEDLSFDQEKIENIDSFLSLVTDELKGSDLESFNKIRLMIDNLNIINPDQYYPYGIYSKEDLNNLNTLDLPSYLTTFLEEQLNKNHLINLFYKYLQELDNNFLKDYLTFYYQLKFLIIYLNCKKFNLNIEDQLIPFDDFTEMLVNGNLPSESWVNEVVTIFKEENLIKRERMLLKIKFEYLDDYLRFEPFTANKIYSHFLKLFELYQLVSLDADKGKTVFDSKIEDIAKQVSRRIDQ